MKGKKTRSIHDQTYTQYAVSAIVSTNGFRIFSNTVFPHVADIDMPFSQILIFFLDAFGYYVDFYNENNTVFLIQDRLPPKMPHFSNAQN